MSRRARTPPKEHRARSSEDHALQGIFATYELFASNGQHPPAFTARELADYLDQPELYIVDMLRKIAEKPTTGPFARSYILLPEYRSTVVQNSMTKYIQENPDEELKREKRDYIAQHPVISTPKGNRSHSRSRPQHEQSQTTERKSYLDLNDNQAPIVDLHDEDDDD